jgi:glutathione S-transferase
MEYVEPSVARTLPGLRLALTVGVPAPYSMSARSVLDLRGVDYVPVAQQPAAENAELLDWTGHRNAPIAVYNNEAPRAGWLEILNLAQRLGSGPELVPENIKERMQMVALTNELIGENGLVWNMRIIMLGLAGPERAAEAARSNPMYAQYGYSEAARAQALAKSQAILAYFTDHVRSQQAAGSHYLIGSSLSALDVYWAYFSQLLRTLSDDECPMPRGLRKSYEMGADVLGECDPALIEQRDFIFANHLKLPMEF